MKHVCLASAVLLVWAVFIADGNTSVAPRGPPARNTNPHRRCSKGADGSWVCTCGKDNVRFDQKGGERCVNGVIVRNGLQASRVPAGLRLATKALHQSARDDKERASFCGVYYTPRVGEMKKEYVPLQNVSVEAWIDTFAADVTLTQVYVNKEDTNIEAVYVFPIEENAAVYSFTAEIDDRTIKAVLKEKQQAENEYQAAVDQGQTAVLLRQSEETLDTFTIKIGALPPGKECRVKIQYVTELDLVDGSAIRFVVPTTIAPRYNPNLGHLQSPDQTEAEYVQNTPYSVSFLAHVLRSEQNKISEVANLSHPVTVRRSAQSIDVSIAATALDRDIILDIDLPTTRPSTFVSVKQHNQSAQHAVLLAFTPTLSDFMKLSDGHDETNTEFIFIVDCSGSMSESDRIGLAREAMLLFVRSLPLGAHFNIIRFGTRYDILFKSEELTTVYNEQSATKAEALSRSLEANFGGTELLEPLRHLKTHPPVIGRSRQVFLLTDGEVSNTDAVIDLCRSMSSTTRIFSFGLGSSPSRALVKGLARATNGYFAFVPPGSKVDTYVGSQFGRALQPSLVNATLVWHGLTKNGSQAPETIPPLYVNDRVLVYQLLSGEDLKREAVSVDLVVGRHKIASVRIPSNTPQNRVSIRRLAAKALIQELQHKSERGVNSVQKQRITALSLTYQILSPYTAFVGVETTKAKNNNTRSAVRHIPIQISKGSEHMFDRTPVLAHFAPGRFGHNSPMAMNHLMGYAPMQMQGHAPHFRYRSPGQSGMQGILAMPGPPAPSSYAASGAAPPSHMSKDSSALADFDSEPVTSTARPSVSGDHVRWLIDQQSFNGAWKLQHDDVGKLTNGKSWSAFASRVTRNQDALSTALAIAVLEAKHAGQRTLWTAVVAKGRKHLQTYGLTSSQVDQLINDIKHSL